MAMTPKDWLVRSQDAWAKAQFCEDKNHRENEVMHDVIRKDVTGQYPDEVAIMKRLIAKKNK